MCLPERFGGDKASGCWGWGLNAWDFQRVVVGRLSVLAVAALFLTVAGCNSDGSVDDTSGADVVTTTTSVPETSTSTPSREDQVVAAYRAHWEAWYAAAQVPDPALP